MAHTNEHIHETHQAHGSLKSYIIGFVLSIVLTIIPLVMVLNHTLSNRALAPIALMFAVLQFLVQLFFFMHIKEGEGPKYNVLALILGIFFVITIVAGSVWIMSFNSVVQ